jgi:hypothetical protein
MIRWNGGGQFHRDHLDAGERVAGIKNQGLRSI